jgi:hypothetical protein
MEMLNPLLHAVFSALFILSGTTIIFLLVLIVGRLRKKDYHGAKKNSDLGGNCNFNRFFCHFSVECNIANRSLAKIGSGISGNR